MIEVKNISKKYGKTHILNDISFNIEKGDCIGIIGANGKGKSTLLSILAGTVRPDCGEFIINNKNAFRHKHLISELIGYCPQDNPLINELTVLDNLKLWYCNSKVGLDKELDEGVLHYLNIDKMLKKTVKQLSGGMKKRLSIGIAMANHPPILILDEPGTALDMACKDDINRYLRHYLDIGGTVIISTHDENEIKLCNRLLFLQNQMIKEISAGITPDELITMIKEDVPYA